MPERVEIIEETELVKRHGFKLKEGTFRHERYDGKMSSAVVRVSFDRGDSVAAVVHDPGADTIVLAEQFRYPAYEKGPGWVIELPAGIITPEEAADPIRTMRRELREEISVDPSAIMLVMAFYSSVGGSSERIHL